MSTYSYLINISWVLKAQTTLKNQAPVLHMLDMSKLKEYFLIFVIISTCRVNKQLLSIYKHFSGKLIHYFLC